MDGLPRRRRYCLTPPWARLRLLHDDLSDTPPKGIQNKKPPSVDLAYGPGHQRCDGTGTADEIKNDPTVRRCLGFAYDWGYGGLIMTNAFAFRSTDPKVMKAQEDPIGPENDAWLVKSSQQANIVVAAWGNHGIFRHRTTHILKLLSNLQCFGTTKLGQPKHPLYLKRDALFVPYR